MHLLCRRFTLLLSNLWMNVPVAGIQLRHQPVVYPSKSVIFTLFTRGKFHGFSRFAY